jgi:hypothetical protein
MLYVASFICFYCTKYDVYVWVGKRLFVNRIVESQAKQHIYSVDLHFNNKSFHGFILPTLERDLQRNTLLL